MPATAAILSSCIFLSFFLLPQVMAEIMAKSKAFKAEKQRQRDEDADETDALDGQFKALLGDPALLGLMRKKGEKR